MKLLARSLAFILGCALTCALAEGDPMASQVGQSSVQPAGDASQLTAAELQQLVAPIALYPDPLVAQILAAATYPTEIVEASRWLQRNSALEGEQLAGAVDPQPWDPSVKALTQFRWVLDNMNQNLAWTSALGDAYVNQPSDVLNAVQVLRQRAQAAGSLQSTDQQSVTTQDQSIVIEPVDPQVVYVPAYDPGLDTERRWRRIRTGLRFRKSSTKDPASTPARDSLLACLPVLAGRGMTGNATGTAEG